MSSSPYESAAGACVPAVPTSDEESEGSSSEEEGGVFRLTPSRGRRFPAVHLLPSSETFLQIFAMHITTERDKWPPQPAHFRSVLHRETWLRANALPVETHRFTFYNCFHATTVENRRNFSLVASDSYRNVPRFDCALIHSDTAVPLVAQILAWFRYSDGPNTFSGAFVQYFPRVPHPPARPRNRNAYTLKSYQRLSVGDYGVVELGSVTAPAAVYPNFNMPTVARSPLDIRSSLLSSQFSEFFLCDKLFNSKSLL